MKRAILVSAGTIAGLAAVLSYSGVEATVASADTTGTTGGAAAGLGGPAPMDSGAPAPADSGAPAPNPSDSAAVVAPSDSAAAPAPADSGAAPTATATVVAPTATNSVVPSTKPSSAAPKPTTSSAAPKPSTTKTSAPKPSATPTPTKTTPKTTPSPSAAAYKDFLGSVVVVPQWGNMQVGIRVQSGKIVDAWAAVYPNADRTSISKNSGAIPKLRTETIGTSTSQIATVAGATLSSNAWIQSLQSAMTAAGL